MLKGVVAQLRQTAALLSVRVYDSGAQLLFTENKSWSESDHHGSGRGPEQQHTAGGQEAWQPSAGGRHTICQLQA